MLNEHRPLVRLRVLPTKKGLGPSDRADVEIYRPFFLAGILSVLTVGCLLGAVALFGIAQRASYTATVWTPFVLAHANSQLFGWVGFFVMGFALQQHAPSVGRVKQFHLLAKASLVLMAMGIALRFAAEPLATTSREVWVPVGVVACILQLAAILLFHYNSGVNRYRTGAKLTWQSAFVFASLGWLTVVAAVEPYVFAMTHQADSQDSIIFVAKWFATYREAQFLGFVAMMIFGVSMVKFHSCFGFREACSKLGLSAWAVWMTGLVARIAGWNLYFDSGMDPRSAILYRLGGSLLALGAVLVVLSLGVFEKPSECFRAHKFVRGGFVWLLIGGLLLALEPLHLARIGMPFSHAFTGAIRHAITVGFISQMIVGVGTHVISRMSDLTESKESQLWAVFWLLNLGNAARVALEIATDYSKSAFIPMGWTGFVELTALALWAMAVVPPMLAKRPANGKPHVC
ncbi:MAG: NnrS family protein [Armatimonadetes bacterium]|nr:NnrS family protein [Armatimonadota bacterium]